MDASFFQSHAPTSRRIWNVWLVWGNEQIQIMSVVIFHIVFGACMIVSLIVKLKIGFWGLNDCMSPLNYVDDLLSLEYW